MKDKQLHDLIIMELARQGKTRTDLARHLCLSYGYFLKKLTNPSQFTLCELRCICRHLNLNLTEVRGLLLYRDYPHYREGQGQHRGGACMEDVIIPGDGSGFGFGSGSGDGDG